MTCPSWTGQTLITLCTYAQQGYAFSHNGLYNYVYIYVEDRYTTQTVLKPSGWL